MTTLTAFILGFAGVAIASIVTRAWTKIEQIRSIAAMHEANARITEANREVLAHIRAMRPAGAAPASFGLEGAGAMAQRADTERPNAQIIPIRKPEEPQT